jgi:RNA polymerase sigma-70 factor (ECF subfamily)
MSKPRASAVALPATNPATAPQPGELLVRAFNDSRDELLSTLCYLLGNADDAQDVAQEAFLRCWRAQESLAGVENIRAWIFRVSINAAKDLQRSAWRRKARPLPGGDVLPLLDASAPSEEAEHRETVLRVREALVHLRPEEREVFLLRENGELTYEQIAEMRQRPVGTVKTQMRSALTKLRKLLA